MKIHSKPLNYLSVPTDLAGLAAAHPVQVIVYLSGWARGGGIALKMTVELLWRAPEKITEPLLPSPEQRTATYCFAASCHHRH
jgi:hypothetical protein